MRVKKEKAGVFLSVMAAFLAAAALLTVLMGGYFAERQFDLLGEVCREVVQQSPQSGSAVVNALKNAGEAGERTGAEYLQGYGYSADDFDKGYSRMYAAAGTGFLAACLLFLSAFFLERRRMARQVEELIRYLEQTGTGQQGLLGRRREDAFSGLRDEMYKTVTALQQTRDRARETKNMFAANLANIAHQMKTPVTAISLCIQRMKEKNTLEYLASVERQIDRLTRLEEALLLMSRMDAGALEFQKKEVDVFTVLEMAAENLEDLSLRKKVAVHVPEQPPVCAWLDPDWTVEAVMNLMKNCLEHSPEGGAVCCDWEDNPLYVRIRIWDEGKGFSGKDLPHLFERFYRGEEAGRDGIGIGLYLAKEILEAQNGALEAYNRPGGGACFEIRLYHR